MKNLTVPSLIIASAMGSLFSQTITQDPASYEPISYTYKKLQLSPSIGLNGSFNSDKSEMFKSNEYKRRDFDFRVTTPMEFRKTKSDSLLYRSFRIDGMPVGFYISRDISSSIEGLESGHNYIFNNNTYRSYVRLSVNNKWFKRPDKLFTSLSGSMNVNGSTNGSIKNGHTADIDTTWSSGTITMDDLYRSQMSITERCRLSQEAYGGSSLSLGVGYGRSYDVTYTAVAIHIINFLGKHNLLLRSENSSVVELSKLLERLKRERVLDDRESRIKHITQICSWLEKKNISKTLNSYHTMEILDLWNYAFNQRRYNGHPLTVGIKGDFDIEYNYSEYEYREKDVDTLLSSSTPLSKDELISLIDSKSDSVYGSYEKKYELTRELTPFIEYDYNKVFGMRSQLLLSAEAQGGVQIEKEKDLKEKKSYIFLTNLDVDYVIFPSLRSDITLTADLKYEKEYSNTTNFEYKNLDNWNGYLSSEFEYYLSPKASFVTSISYSMNINRDTDKSEKSNTSVHGNYGISSRFIYKLF